MSTLKSSLLSAALVVSTTGTAFAGLDDSASPGPVVEVLPPDEDASPKPGEQHPPGYLIGSTTFQPALSVPGTALIKSAGKKVGNSKWGARWLALSSAWGEHKSATDGKVRADAGAEFEVTLFSHTHSVFETQMTAVSHTAGNNSATIDAYLVGQKIIDKAYTHASDASAGWNYGWSKTFFKYSHTWTLGPIPVVVKVGASGGVGLAADADAPENLARVSFGPYAHLDGSLAVGVGIDLGLIEASAGFEGHVRFIEAGLEFANEVKRQVVALGTTKYSYDMSVDAELETLDGHINIYAIWDGLILYKKWTKKILDWDGVSVDKTLWNVQGDKTFNDGVIVGNG